MFFLAFFIVIEFLIISIGLIIYSCYFYYQNLFYKTQEYRPFYMWPLFIVVIIFLIMSIVAFVYTYSNNKIEFFVNNFYIPYFSLIISLSCLIIMWLIFYTKKNTSSNHNLKDFWNENFEVLIQQYNKKIESNNKIIFFQKLRPKYYKNMKHTYKEIENKIENNNQEFKVLINEIIKFNEKFTSRFFPANNIVQMIYFLKLCQKIKNFF